MTTRALIIFLLTILTVGCSTNAGVQAVPAAENVVSQDAVNINTAAAEELQTIPHIGASMADKIIEHRERFGPFKRSEELMLIQGISDARFRRIRHLIRVE